LDLCFAGQRPRLCLAEEIPTSYAEENCGCDGDEADGGVAIAGEFPLYVGGLTPLLRVCAWMHR
jgi:hypothetical protein